MCRITPAIRAEHSLKPDAAGMALGCSAPSPTRVRCKTKHDVQR